jgi:hypothetical protein
MGSFLLGDGMIFLKSVLGGISGERRAGWNWTGSGVGD